MLDIEVLARLCLPTMLALGLSLSIESGYLDAPRQWLVAIWVVAAGWVALVWTLHRGRGAELAGNLARVDLGLRSVVCVALWIAGLGSTFGDGGLFIGNWLGAKVVLFAIIMSCGIAIRFALRPFGPAFAALVAADGSGASGDAHDIIDLHETSMARSISRARPLVVVIWTSLAASTILAVTRAVPW